MKRSKQRSNQSGLFGLININKPPGITSRDAVNKIHRVVKPAKVGHCGTLDPLATGVLVICVGPATRLANYVQQSQKVYRGVFRLGCESETEDIESELIEVENAPIVTADQLESALVRFRGDIEQMPPRFSALRVNGKRAYDLAREGVEVELKARTVSITRLELVAFDFPSFELEIVCGAGTYIRSLGRDIGRAVGSGAVMIALQRTAIGGFDVAAGLHPDDVHRDNLQDVLMSPMLGLGHFPKVNLTDVQADQIQYGTFVHLIDPATNKPFVDREVAGLDGDGQLLAVLRRREDGSYFPGINFVGKS